MNILLIEDDDDHATAVEMRLRWIPATTTVRARGRVEALNLARTASPDFIILDLEFDNDVSIGAKILADLDADPDLAQIPVIVFSVHARGEDAVRAIRNGAGWTIDKNADQALRLLEETITTQSKKLSPRKPRTLTPPRPFWYDAEHHELYIQGERQDPPQELMPRDFRVLALLCERANEVLSWDEIATVAESGDAADDQEEASGKRKRRNAPMSQEAVEKMMARLAQRLGAAARYITKLRGAQWILRCS